MSIVTWEFESPPLHLFIAEIAQLVEHNLAKVGVAGPSPVFRSLLLFEFFLLNVIEGKTFYFLCFSHITSNIILIYEHLP